MPLFMDLHSNTSGNFSIEALVEKHKADLRVQRKYGVKFKRVWVNEDQGMVFCLMEGPDRQSCENVHQEAHGDTGCNIVSVKPWQEELFFSGSRVNQGEIALMPDGRMDSGYRTLVQIGLFDPPFSNRHELDLITRRLTRFKGDVIIDADMSVKAVFVSAAKAVAGAIGIQKSLNKLDSVRDFRIAVVSGNPVYEDHDKFYGYAFELSQNLLISGRAGMIRSTQLTFDLVNKEVGYDAAELKNIQTLSIEDEKLTGRLLHCIHANFSDPDFTAEVFARKIGLSRSQLFRKVKAITGDTPNHLIPEVRLVKAIEQLQTGQDQIGQIAFDTGFNSPSYFTKVFSKRYAILPSHITRNRI